MSKQEELLLEEKKQHYQYKQKELTKQINRIEKSRSWQYSKPIRLLQRMKDRIIPSGMNKTVAEQLRKENIMLKQELLKQEEQIEQMGEFVSQMNSLDREGYLRDLKNSGKLLNYLQSYSSDKRRLNEAMKETLIYIARLYMNESDEKRDYVYRIVKDSLHVDELPEFILRPGLENKLALSEVASYRASLAMRLRQYQYDQALPEWILDDKRLAYQFVKQFNILTPKVDEKTYSIETIPRQTGIVIKPVDGAGARGVYIVHDEENIVDVKKHERLSSWDDLIKHLHDDLQEGAVAEDAWMIEEVIYEDKQTFKTGRDLKFYMFYGKVGVILEIVRYPELRQCWWTGDLRRIHVGKYDESLFQGQGVTENQIKMVEQLSKAIPAPFIRIDFLQGEEDLVFGEFTPKPGNYDEFNDEVDQQLGDLFIKAQSEIEKAYLNGEEFNQIQAILNNEKSLLSDM
ncbi:MAG TPA: ATP-grasp fold amidoligase family protein [Pseudogracilibacillus sp.]|nr:ATP-grasp fold amidoligase family protein [Pseudogracilibacillus sp.]